MESYSELLNNTLLLLALGLIYDTLGIYKISNRLVRDLISGLLVGALGMAVMLTPWMLAPGIFFDTRWVLISLSALFFGPTTTFFAVAMTVSLRLFQGGAGMYVGSLVIITAAAIGLLWRWLAAKKNWQLGWFNLYLLGFLVQIAVLSCMYFMPEAVRWRIVTALAPPLLTIFPIGTMLFGLVLRRQRDRRRSEFELIESRKLLDRERGLLRGLIDSIPEVIFIKDPQGKYLGCNQAFEQTVGIPEQKAVGLNDHEIFNTDIADRIVLQDKQVLEKGVPVNGEEWVTFPDGRRRLMSYTKAPFRGLDGTLYGLAGISRDITERRQAEQEREQLREQLALAQRIESVGQLAGGIAHDFNNMLAVIIGQAELAMLRLDNQTRVKSAITEIRNAAKRSSDLTQQLLAFARKQPTSPKLLNINKNVAGMFKMLRRVIGEDIQFRLKLERDLWMVKIDPSQLDQVLTNLCVNARDAIDGHGKVVIETSNAVLDKDWCAMHTDHQPGEYVIIAVSDNGRGITEEVRQQIFDPFFTTKKQGEGTGLGLATVYGIIKQNDGFIDVISAPGQGSTFKVYLPREVGAETTIEEQEQAELPQGSETILLVEDEEAVLRLAQDMLESLGYQILATSSPGTAFQIAEAHSGTIDLLLTDVIMPELNGRRLAEQLLESYPELKVLFMSGYTADIIDHQGVLDEGGTFLEKPFMLEDLARKVRATLDHR